MRISLFLVLFVLFSVTAFSDDSGIQSDTQTPDAQAVENPDVIEEPAEPQTLENEPPLEEIVPEENGSADSTSENFPIELPQEETTTVETNSNENPEVLDDINAIVENPVPPIADSNEIIPDEQQEIPEPIFVYPLEFQNLRGLEVIIVSVRGANAFELNRIELGGTSFETIASENTISADINTLLFPNGSHLLNAEVCSGEDCSSKEISIQIENQILQQQEIADQNEIIEIIEVPLEEIPEHEITPSNVFSALSLFDLNGNLVDSGSEKVRAKKGKFKAKIEFFGETIETIELDSLEIDSNALLVEIEEDISLELPSPDANVFWKKIVAVNPKANFSSGKLKLKVPQESEYLYKCADWNFAEKNCEGSWEKIFDLAGEQSIEIQISPFDPGFGFAAKNPGNISFDRLIDCPKCGQHKVSPKTTVEMTITADASQEVQNGLLEDYFPSEWIMVLENGGIVSDVNSEFKKISWSVGTFAGNISRTYQIFSPERTTPPTDYYFFSSVGGESSDYWSVKVADPATDVNLTVQNCSGGTTINSCAGVNTLGSAQDVVSAKNAVANFGMNNGSYSNSINSVTFWSNHSGASGIDGAVAYTLENAVGTDYCAEDATITNTTSFVLSSDPGCTPTGGWTTAKLDDLNVLIKNTDTGQGQSAYYDYLTITVNYTPNGTLSFSITNPSADNNTSVNNNTNFLVNGTVTCNTDNCGSVDTNVQYCIGAGCSSWMDVNSDVGSPLLLVSGSQPQSQGDMNATESYNVSWVLKSNVAQTYELRFRATGTIADTNTTSGTDRTITTQAVADDYSFTLSLPSSGCTQGKGSTDGSADCEKGYFETTDLTGFADQTKVDPEGQTSSIYLFVYDNQSTTSSDLNITLDLNAALPATLKLKVSQAYTGWSSVCSGASDVNCVEITTSAPSIGKATYSTGTKDLNMFLWADFVTAGVLTESRDVNSASVSPT